MRYFFTVVVFFLLVPIASEGESRQATIYHVRIESMNFEPKELVIKKGDRVEWINHDLVPHTVTDPSGTFDSGVILPEGRWSHPFSNGSDVPYRCTLHPEMSGVIHIG